MQEQLSLQEQRLKQNAAAHGERMTEMEQDLQREALQCGHLREEIQHLRNHVI